MRKGGGEPEERFSREEEGALKERHASPPASNFDPFYHTINHETPPCDGIRWPGDLKEPLAPQSDRISLALRATAPAAPANPPLYRAMGSLGPS